MFVNLNNLVSKNGLYTVHVCALCVCVVLHVLMRVHAHHIHTTCMLVRARTQNRKLYEVQMMSD